MDLICICYGLSCVHGSVELSIALRDFKRMCDLITALPVPSLFCFLNCWGTNRKANRKISISFAFAEFRFHFCFHNRIKTPVVKPITCLEFRRNNTILVERFPILFKQLSKRTFSLYSRHLCVNLCQTGL